MFIQMKTITVTEGNADKIVERFSQESAVEKSDGFIDLSVLVKKNRRGDEEVVVMIRWESQEHWKKWTTSDAHVEGHRQSKGKPKPDFIIQTEQNLYEVKAIRSSVR